MFPFGLITHTHRHSHLNAFPDVAVPLLLPSRDAGVATTVAIEYYVFDANVVCVCVCVDAMACRHENAVYRKGVTFHLNA